MVGPRRPSGRCVQWILPSLTFIYHSCGKHNILMLSGWEPCGMWMWRRSGTHTHTVEKVVSNSKVESAIRSRTHTRTHARPPWKWSNWKSTDRTIRLYYNITRRVFYYNASKYSLCFEDLMGWGGFARPLPVVFLLLHLIFVLYIHFHRRWLAVCWAATATSTCCQKYNDVTSNSIKGRRQWNGRATAQQEPKGGNRE